MFHITSLLNSFLKDKPDRLIQTGELLIVKMPRFLIRPQLRVP
ncbi:hypothetical protein BCO26_2397 [Heyndrickxia coagulans 2-6]|nr:hypothetical protein BCO26_2397 [Heyndrickxia coagulans 2-6]